MTIPEWLQTADRTAPWRKLRVCVAGIRLAGFSAAEALVHLGAHVTVVDAKDGQPERERATILEILGGHARLGDAETLPEGTQLLVVSPGFRPDAPIVRAAEEAGIPVWGDVELAWRLRPTENPAPWLCVTGTNGKTTTVRMLASILRAAGKRAIAAGNVGTPILEAVLADEPYDVIAVELSSFQLHYTHSMRPLAAAVLNVAPDHLDWHGSFEAYAKAKGRIYENCKIACVYNVADPLTEQLVRDAEVEEGCRAIGFGLGVPGVSEFGVVDEVLCDRAFLAERWTTAAEIGTVADIQPPAPHNIANALAAAALARAYGVPPVAVRDGLRAFRPDAHRIAHVATVDEVDYVDDSKATNPHAAAASLAAYRSVVWIAGGLAKGADFDDLVKSAAERLRAVVLIGTDRDKIRTALERHAPDVPVVEVADTDTGVMERVVAEARRLAQPGDTVLLAPACASMDMFRDYGERGDRFAEAVRRLS
ncbi:UDP-N-acetylmuramoylalanine--D-glutamate ligase [Carbonactinospora thermoautotrophica]|uniref:UDP-N-acetylmuramoylalanine--D-glutamate ligase n=1 Tax=Carbonactinospora thermoautotrophica TaxID=1469144 RepID=A0A132MV19_9ACTN|nr:UDP-N-acetylmuramoyl-L-alanine--D-glutamate ligase [Carbonactinospora thermoautotrophica]KWX01586.1 UDP-N-acetylmuramoylalanine--D-glutamate ligase [Carbonactinospora thermoautotrophica]